MMYKQFPHCNEARPLPVVKEPDIFPVSVNTWLLPFSTLNYESFVYCFQWKEA